MKYYKGISFTSPIALCQMDIEFLAGLQNPIPSKSKRRRPTVSGAFVDGQLPHSYGEMAVVCGINPHEWQKERRRRIAREREVEVEYF